VGQRRIGKQVDGKEHPSKKQKKNDVGEVLEQKDKQNTEETKTVKKPDAETVIANSKEDANKITKDENGAAQFGKNTGGAETKPPDFVVSHEPSDIGKENTLVNSELKGKTDKIDDQEAIENSSSTQNTIEGEQEETTEGKDKTTEKETKTAKIVKINHSDTEDESQEIVKNEENSTQGTKLERNNKEANGTDVKDQDTKGRQEKEINDATTITFKVAGDRPKDKGRSESSEEEPETKMVATGNSVQNNSDIGKPEATNFLHQVVQGRVVPMKETHEIAKTITEIRHETEEEKSQKRLDVLEAKMKNYRRMKKSDINIIDFEESVFACEAMNRKVVLEDVLISGREVSGVIVICCDEKHPDVTVRYTFDSWKSIANEKAIPFDATGNGNKIFRRFFFAIFVPFAKSLEFAVRLLGDLGTFWDNNSQNNYLVENIKENESAARLIAKFTPQKQAMLNELLERNYVILKSASLKDGKATLTIATKESCSGLLGVRFTLDDWKTSADVTEIAGKDEEEGHNVSKIQVDIPKQKKMKLSIFWRYEGAEHWDNNSGKNYEIQG